MSTIVTRTGKGSILTVAEMDANLNNLNNDVTIAFKYKGVLDASGGVYPSTPVQGDTYVVSVTGTISAVLYSVDDMLFYNGAAWKRLVAGSGVFTASSRVTVNSSSAALTVTQTGAGNAFVVEDSASTDSTPFVIDASGNLLIGYSTQLTVTGAGSRWQGAGTGQEANVALIRYSDTVGTAPNINLARARGSVVGTNTVVQSGDVLASINFGGGDGSALLAAAQISALVDGTPGANDMPGRLVFSTTADGASSPTERMRIDSAGNVGIGGAAQAFSRLELAGTFPSSSAITIAAHASGVIPSGTTNVARMFSTTPSTQAAAFTCSNLQHYYAEQGTIGAGSAVTNQYGFLATNTLTGATNNYGFYSNIAAGANRWNFYAGGTADNYFGGKVVFNAALVEKKTAPAISTNVLVLDLSSSALFAVSLNAAVTTLTLSNPPAASGLCTFILEFTADGTPRSVTWPAAVKWSGGTAPTLTSTNAKKDAFALYTYDGGTTYIASVIGQNF